MIPLWVYLVSYTTFKLIFPSSLSSFSEHRNHQDAFQQNKNIFLKKFMETPYL